MDGIVDASMDGFMDGWMNGETEEGMEGVGVLIGSSIWRWLPVSQVRDQHAHAGKGNGQGSRRKEKKRWDKINK